MPSSFASSFPPIVNLLVEVSPKRVIDVGCGWGKYGLACREYLPNLEALHAIEVTQGIKDIQDHIYDWSYVGDARRLTHPEFWKRWDLALLIDVIEHMTREEGHRLLAAITNAGCEVLVATPKVFFEQSSDTNPHETHLSLWDWRAFVPFGIRKDVSTEDAIIFLLGP